MIDSVIRTVSAIVIAHLLTLAAKAGITLDSAAVEIVVTATVGGTAYWVIRWAESRWPVIGRWLLGLGIVDTQPVYRPTESAPPRGYDAR
ncbi:hypothetical protein LO762_16390 [Actinocorallia sp. API 0066]|uniref:hypothetical protein n=1 Tax=Actinocorallia sp. API 0066 TaxID=2896846 RepID=UPI001E4AEDE6|nr:hypothetical protein [Actinocorallia sp. API 0066]MCD0450757.1 hypothetical protein [Actinocorallia sp. API 0066]